MVPRGWVRRLPFLLGLLATAMLAGTVAPDPAAGQTVTPFESLRANPGSSMYLNDFYTKILSDSERSATWRSTASTWTTGQQNVIETRWTKAARAARLLPKFAPIATKVTLAGTAAYIGWRVYQHYTSDDVTFDTWLDSAALGKDALFNGLGVPFGPSVDKLLWIPPLSGTFGWPGFTGAGQAYPYFNVAGPSAPASESIGAVWVYGTTGGSNLADRTNFSCYPNAAPCWILFLYPAVVPWAGASPSTGWAYTRFRPDAAGWQCSRLDAADACAGWWWDYDEAATNGFLGSYYGSTAEQQLAYMVARTFRNISEHVESVAPAALKDVGKGCSAMTNELTCAVGSTVRNTKYRVVLTPDEFADLGFTGVVAPSTTPDETYEQDYTVPAPYTAPGDPGTTADTDAALTELDSSCGRAFVNWVLEPGIYTFNPASCGGWEPDPATFLLYPPNVNETYTQYVTRLQANGYLGTATTIEVDPDDALVQMGPEGVVSVKIGTNTYRPGSWPSPAPRWNVSVNMTIRYNPASVPQAPGTGEPLPPGGGGTAVPVPPAGPLGDWCEACPPVDFGPLTGVAYGDSFPFGVVVWVGDYVGTLTTAPQAPAWDFDFTSFDAGGMGPYDLGHYTVDLDVLDSYMSIIRTILAWVIWIGGVWWFGSRLLGFRETGDPGAAVDEAWS